jgi:nicotinate-nucleotide adenylyltransferase
MRLGIFGGTFDPPHIGHLVLAAEAHFQLDLERVLWLLTPHSPLKLDRQIHATEARVEMLAAALTGNPSFEISRADIDYPAPHYAVDTMERLHNQHPHHEIVYLMGGDSLRDLPSWHKPQEFVKSCDLLGVMRRPGDAVNLEQLEAVLPGLSARVRFVEAPLLEISASDVRRRIAEGLPFRYFLPEDVYRLIVEREWYRTQLGNRESG